VLRQFKVGDFISAGGVTGTVDEVGLFVTTIDTPDNVRTFVGNNKLFADNIQNFSAKSVPPGGVVGADIGRGGSEGGDCRAEAED
jgi:small-conductance mechanosensitive channel